MNEFGPGFEACESLSVFSIEPNVFAFTSKPKVPRGRSQEEKGKRKKREEDAKATLLFSLPLRL